MAETSIILLHPSRWREAKALRLQALQDDPSAFATSYEEALAYADEVWTSRTKAAFERDGAIALYAEVAGKLVGMAGAGWSNRRKTRHVAEVYAVYVNPNHRGKGIGAALMLGLLDELKALPQIEKVKLGVTSSNAAAVTLYRRLGFETVGNAKRALQVDGRYYDLQHMELWLR